MVRWAALLHDIAKPRTRTVDDGVVHFYGHDYLGEQMARKILQGLRSWTATRSSRSASWWRCTSAPTPYEDDWTDGAVRRFIREAGDVLEDLLDLSAADVTSKRQERIRAAGARVSALRERIERIRAEEEVEKLASPLDGNELMALFGRQPGPWIRPVKERLLAAVLDGELGPDDKEGATKLAREVMGVPADV